MAGYCGYSMSNNAVAAYLDGEKPLSKWSKESLLEGIAETYSASLSTAVSGWTLPKLRSVFLTKSSWHHTSKHYNETAFYRVSPDLKTTFDALWERRHGRKDRPAFCYPPARWAELDAKNGVWGDYARGSIPIEEDAPDNSAAEIRSYELNRLLYKLGALRFMLDNMEPGTSAIIDGFIFKKSARGNVMLFENGSFQHIPAQHAR